MPTQDAPSTTTTIESFLAVDIRTGRVVRAEPFDKARKPAIKLWVDFGEQVGVKQSSAQLTDRYAPDDLVGRMVLAVVNFPPRQIADFVSEVLVLGVPTDGNRDVVLVQPEREVAPGLRVA